ncbi:uncharacterized protein [Ambystoma mexicanum]|uniref:uncharacterized protein n=1 Tax=Ambystoma mexicanum TaxID=8296 RepID=UPI0037E984C5
MEKKGVIVNTEGKTSSIELARVTTRRHPKKESKTARVDDKPVIQQPSPREFRKQVETPRQNIKKNSSNAPSDEKLFPSNGRKQLPDIDLIKEYSRRYVNQAPSEVNIREKELNYRSSLDVRKQQTGEKKKILPPSVTKEATSKTVKADQNTINREDRGAPHSLLRDASKQLPEIELMKEYSRRYLKQQSIEDNAREKELNYRSSLDIRKQAVEKKKILPPASAKESITKNLKADQHIVNRDDKGALHSTLREASKQARDGQKVQPSPNIAPFNRGFILPKIKLDAIEEKKEEKAPILCPPIDANRKVLDPEPRSFTIFSREVAEKLFKSQESNAGEVKRQGKEGCENEQHVAALLGTKSTEKILPRLDKHVRANGTEVSDPEHHRPTLLGSKRAKEILERPLSKIDKVEKQGKEVLNPEQRKPTLLASIRANERFERPLSKMDIMDNEGKEVSYTERPKSSLLGSKRVMELFGSTHFRINTMEDAGKETSFLLLLKSLRDSKHVKH